MNILYTRTDLSSLSIWERYLHKAKLMMYNLMHDILLSNTVTPIFFNVLTFIESMQLIYFSIHSKYDFIWSISIFTYLRSSIEYFQYNTIMNLGNKSINLALLYISVCIEILMAVIFGFTCYFTTKREERTTSSIASYCFRLLSFFAVLILTIIPLPFFNIYFAILYCNPDSEVHSNDTCYQGDYLIHVVLAAIGTILLLFYSILFGLLLIDLNPHSKIAYAAPESKSNLFKLLIKIIIPLYITFDYKLSSGAIFIIIISIIYGILLIQRFRLIPQYNRSVRHFTIAMESTVFWISLCSFIQANLDVEEVDDIGFYFMIICIPVVIKMMLILVDNRQWKYLTQRPFKIKKQEDMIIYLITLIDLIEERHNLKKKIMLEGVLRMHTAIRCKQAPVSCPCQQLSALQRNQESSEDQQRMWYLYIKSIIQGFLERIPKSSKLHIFNAFTYYSKLSNMFKSLREMMTTEEYKPTVQQEFQLVRYKRIIEEDIIVTDSRNEQNKSVDVNSIVHFENRYVLFSKAVSESVDLHLKFWQELLEDNPDIQKLQAVGSKISYSIEEVEKQFKKLVKINPNNIRSLDIYGHYLKQIVNNDAEGQRVIEKADYVRKSAYINKQFADNEKVKYSENSNTAVITVSGNNQTVHNLTNCNYDFTRILGFQKVDVQDQNIYQIMPKAFQEIHDNMMVNVLETSHSRAIGKERLVMPVNKEGYIVPSILMIKLLPNLSEGIQLVGFLKEKDEIYCAPYVRSDYEETRTIHYLIYKQDDLTIIGVTQSVEQDFGIPLALVNANTPNAHQFTIDLICPNILDKEVQEDMKTENGALVGIDTSLILKNFLLQKGNDKVNNSVNKSVNNQGWQQEEAPTKNAAAAATAQRKDNVSEVDNESQNDLEWGKKFRKSKIRIHLEENFSFQHISMQIIKFYEDNDEEEYSLNDGEVENMNNFGSNKEMENENKLVQGNDVGKAKDKDPRYEEHGNNGVDNSKLIDQGDQMAEDNNNSNQNSIANTEVGNDDMKQLKDIKTAISEKNVPQSIKNLQRTIIMLIITICVITGVDFSYKQKQKDQIQEGAQSFYYAYMRHNAMADVNFYLRYIYMIANIIKQSDMYKYEAGTTYEQLGKLYKDLLNEAVNTLQDFEFKVLKAYIDMQERGAGKIAQQSYKLNFLLSNGTPWSQSYNFTDGILQMITAASSLANSTVESFANFSQQINQISNQQMNFYFVRNNGLFILRNGSEVIADIYFQFYYDLITDLYQIFQLLMILLLIFLGISLSILIPIVFSVHKTNNRVLSLFALVPIDKIQQMANKCEQFMTDFNDHRFEKNQFQDDEQLEGGQDSTNENNNMQQKASNVGGNEGGKLVQTNGVGKNSKLNNSELDISVHQNINTKHGFAPNINEQSFMQNNDSSMNYGQQQQQYLELPAKNGQRPVVNSQNFKENNLQVQNNNLQVNKNDVSALNTSNNQFIKDTEHNKKESGIAAKVAASVTIKDQKNVLKKQHTKEDGQKHMQQQIDTDVENQRSQKLLNSKSESKRQIVFQFGLLAILYVLYYVVSFLVEIQFLSDVEQVYNNLRVSSMRPTYIKYQVIYTLEQFVVNEVMVEGGQNILTLFTNRNYNNEELVLNYYKSGLPRQFSDFEQDFADINYKDICIYSIQKFDSDNINNCNLIQQGLLKKGLRTAIIALTEISRDMVSRFNPKSLEDQINAANSQQFKDLVKMQNYIVPAILLLNNKLLAAIEVFLSDQLTMETIKYVVFLLSLFAIFAFIWVPYLNTLSKRIWRTKGMLNMIPMEIITQNEGLKNAFTNGDILRAVK